MLVLSRKELEKIVMSIDGKPIGTIKIVEIRGRDNTVRVGFEGFDKSIGINRQEVYDKIQEEQSDAADQ